MNVSQFFNVLFFGQPHARQSKSLNPAIANQIRNVQRVWRNETHKDFGVERIVRLTLALLLFTHLSLYLRHFFGRFGLLWRKVGVELYVFSKLLLPISILALSAYSHGFFCVLAIYMAYETLTYLASLVYLSNEFAQPISYRRSITTLFMNYVEVALDYAIVYAYFNHNHPGFMNKPFTSVMDSVYFSFMTSATVGYGDFFPVTQSAKFLAVTQVLTFVVFIGLFLSFFVAKVNDPTYYNTKPDRSNQSKA